MKRAVIVLIVGICGLLMSACGTVATPIWEAPIEPTVLATKLSEEVTSEAHEATVEPSPEPSATELPPTATPEPATAVPATATPAPTEVPTEVVTAEPTVEATAAVVEAGGDDAAITAALAAGDPVAGQQVFIAAAPAPCSTCHLVDSESMLVGPGLLNLADRAGSRVPGLNAVEYIHQSIVDPAAHIVEGYAGGMLPGYDVSLTEQQLNDLIAYLLTLQD